MPRLLIICPSVRTQSACRMYESLRRTSDADIFFISRPGHTTTCINEAYQNAPRYDYYHVTNDDFIYHTPGWDSIFIDRIEANNGFGIAFGNDLLNGPHLPSVSVVSKKLLDCLGWLQLPGLWYLYGDQVWKYIGESLGILFYHSRVIIEHQHRINKKADDDEVYQKTNAREVYLHDSDVFNEWRKTGARTEIERIRLAMQSVRGNGELSCRRD